MNFDEFTNLYSISKTLRFELKPVGKTLDWITKNKLVEEDEKRAEDYKTVKKIIDRYHKEFIEEAFESALNANSFQRDMKDLIESYSELYYKEDKSDKDKKELENISSQMRQEIVSCFEGNYSDEVKKKFSNLFKKELIKQDLLNFCQPSEKEVIEKFADFTTYFGGFHENRKNMYSSEEKSTAISHRIVHENLPRFLDNLKVFNSLKEEYQDFPWNQLEFNLKNIDPSLKLEDYFSKKGFILTFTQKGIDRYNLILGGKSLDSGQKVQGLNELINLYRQKKCLDRRKIPNLKELYKQILSDRVKFSFIPEKFLSDNSLLEAIRNFHEEVINAKIEIDSKQVNFLEALKNTIQGIKAHKLEKIYISNDLGLTNISNFLYGEWSKIKSALFYYYDEKIADKGKGDKQSKKYQEGREKWIKKDYYSVQKLNEAITLYSKYSEDGFEATPLEEYFSKFKTRDENRAELDILSNIEQSYSELKPLLEKEYLKNKNLKSDKYNIEKIKNYMDSIKILQNFLKPLTPKKILEEKDLGFYNEFETYVESLQSFNRLYNKVRNYLTEKEYSVEKFKLNFENSTLLNGWDENKESANLGIILRDEDKYYLGIMNKNYKKIFSNIPKLKSSEAYYEKMVYKLLPGANKMLPKVFFAKSNIGFFQPSQKILDIKNSESFKKGDNFNLKDCHELIDFYKESISKHEDWSKFNFHFSETSSYQDISEFFREVEAQGYKITFNQVSKDYIHSLVEYGKLYLFQIYSKDFSEKKKSNGKPNLHTIYFKALFDEENLKDVVVKLNGEAEVFYRKKSINYDPEIREKGHHYEELKDKFTYPIIKDKRYAEDKFHFHFPITLNFKPKERSNFNLEVRKFLKASKDVNIIGIDRGERHLLYLVMINQEGKILKQLSLNTIQNEKQAVNYKEILQKREIARNQARKSWRTVENIKELKEGYLSQVVHKISKMMVEHKAIVVLEDLNLGFKRGRQKVERQVYQKFEKMLIDKLNFLVLKDRKNNEPGGILKAYQLTDKFVSFENIGKQTGFLFYVPAWNTSKIDPKTGFVNFLHLKYENVQQAKDLIGKFDSIRYNKQKDWFEFQVTTDKFFTKENLPESRTWTICSTPTTRYYTEKTTNSSIVTNEINVNEKLKELLSEFHFEDGKELKEKILQKDTKDFFSKLIFYLRVLTSLRQNNGKIGDQEKDFILSPVADSKGNFFNSLEAKDDEPNDADANGAYHIALKGLMNLQVLKQTQEENLDKPNWKIKNTDWLHFVWNRQN